MAVNSSYKDAPTRTVSAGAVDLVYRELGPKAGVPVVVLVQPLAVVVVGASRIYLGAHWMIGVLGGMPWATSVAVAVVVLVSSRGTGGANTTAEGGEWRLLGAAGGLNPPAAPRRGDVVCGTNAGRETGGPARSASLTCARVWPESPCLHLDQGGDENSDDAFPLVVPTGFEPVSPP